MPIRPALSCLLLSAIVLSGCSGPPSAPPDEPASDAAISPATVAATDSVAGAPPVAAPRLTACELVTAAEMSAILGTEMQAQPDDRRGDMTHCAYKPTTGYSPYAQLVVAWGGADAATEARAQVEKNRPEAIAALQGIGDEAFLVGPMLNVRHGENSVQITLGGVADMPAAARRVFDTAQPRL